MRSDHRDALPRLRDIAGGLGDLEIAPLLVGTSVVAALVVLQRFPRVPGPLLVVLGASAATAWSISSVTPSTQWELCPAGCPRSRSRRSPRASGRGCSAPLSASRSSRSAATS
jgi:MFS superfamily sulfate permease-like transporter